LKWALYDLEKLKFLANYGRSGSWLLTLPFPSKSWLARKEGKMASAFRVDFHVICFDWLCHLSCWFILYSGDANPYAYNHLTICGKAIYLPLLTVISDSAIGRGLSGNTRETTRKMIKSGKIRVEAGILKGLRLQWK